MSPPHLMDHAIVAIITRTKNRPVFLRRAISSVLGQEYPHWVHVIVNDGGDTGPVDALVAEFTGEYAGRIQVIHLPESIGMQPAANHAIQHSSSELLAIHDDDDSWEPAFLGACAHYLAREGGNSGYQGVITHTVRIWENVLADGTIEEVSREPYIPLNQISLFRLGYENPFAPIAFVYRRKVYDEVGGYNPAFSYAADMEFNLRFLQRYDIGVIPEPLAHYHWRKEAASGEMHNTVTAQARVHERLNNEILNASLREKSSTSTTVGLGLNQAPYLLTLEWLAKCILEIDRRLDDRVLRVLNQLGEGDAGGRVPQITLAVANSLDRLVDLKAHLTNQSENLKTLLTLPHSSIQQDKILADLKSHLCSHTGYLETVIQLLQTQTSVTQGNIKELSNDLANFKKEVWGRQLFRIGRFALHKLPKVQKP